jgi:NTE family protein
MNAAASSEHVSAAPATAFVLGGGGLLGAGQVGMLRALVEAGVHPDLVVGTSVGALNGVLFAADPGPASVECLEQLWSSLHRSGVFADSVLRQAARVAKYRTHLHSAAPLRRLLNEVLPVHRFEDLAVPFHCVAANIEQARAAWFDRGELIDAVVASCAVPGLLPPVRIDGLHYVDGGLVQSIPLSRAVRLGARRIYVLQVGRAERPLVAPRWPWEVGTVAFEIARRAHFVDEMERLPEHASVHVLPTGRTSTPIVNVRYRDTRAVATSIENAYHASVDYLAGVDLTS